MKSLRFLILLCFSLFGTTCKKQASKLMSSKVEKKSFGYSNNKTPGLYHEKWMKNLPDTVPIKMISIPGTHGSSSYAHPKNLIVLNQSMNLNTQLKAGIRAIDMRLRVFQNSLITHHGAFNLKATFDDVLNTIRAFLDKNPSETIIMLAKEEYSNSPLFNAYFKRYLTKNKDLFWNTQVNRNKNYPTLGELRGRIFLLKRFWSDDPELLKFGKHYDSSLHMVQDNYSLTSNWDLYRKWNDVKNHLYLANANWTKDHLYINFLSGSGGAFPYFVASGNRSYASNAKNLLTGLVKIKGNIWPDFPRTLCAGKLCSIAFEGINELTLKLLNKDQINFTGILMMDFPSDHLIKKIIDLNVLRKKHENIAFQGKPLPSAFYTITSEAGNRCMIIGNNGQDKVPILHNWGVKGARCGFPDLNNNNVHYDDLGNNGQALFRLTHLKGDMYIIEKKMLNGVMKCMTVQNERKLQRKGEILFKKLGKSKLFCGLADENNNGTNFDEIIKDQRAVFTLTRVSDKKHQSHYVFSKKSFVENKSYCLLAGKDQTINTLKLVSFSDNSMLCGFLDKNQDGDNHKEILDNGQVVFEVQAGVFDWKRYIDAMNEL